MKTNRKRIRFLKEIDNKLQWGQKLQAQMLIRDQIKILKKEDEKK